jgi:hypothetical protein
MQKAELVETRAKAFAERFQSLLSSNDATFYVHIFFADIPRVIRELPCDIVDCNAEAGEHLNGVVKRQLLHTNHRVSPSKYETKRFTPKHLQVAKVVVARQMAPRNERSANRLVKIEKQGKVGKIISIND